MQKGSPRFAVEAGFTPILIVLLVAVLGIGGYFVYTNYSNLSRVKSRDNQTKPAPYVKTTQTPTPTESTNSAETANWKTYTNKILGFSLKYPPEYIVQKDTNTKVIIENPDYFGTLTITTNIDNYKVLKKCSEVALGDPCASKITQTTLDGKKAITFFTGDGETIQTTETPKIQLHMDLRGGGLDNIFDQILSTFKFTQ